MNRSRRRRLALRVAAVVLGFGALGVGGVALAVDSTWGVAPAEVTTPVAPSPSTDSSPDPSPSPSSSALYYSPNDSTWG
jgi:hypothetical protein